MGKFAKTKVYASYHVMIGLDKILGVSPKGHGKERYCALTQQWIEK